MQYQETLENTNTNLVTQSRGGGKGKYIPAVDGLRALGVLTVLFYHLRLPFAKSGLLGVTVFFVLSGFLVTRLLLGEADTTGTIDLKDFLRRRGRRIMPVMITMILVMSIVYTFLDTFLLGKMRPDIVPSILIFNNWWQLIQNVSYFAAQGAPSPLTHYWSLAIEGQFYLIWPFIVLLFAKMRFGRMARGGEAGGWKALMVVTAVMMIVSAVLMAVYFDPNAESSRAYYGTDSRCFSLLAGSLLAMWEAEGGMHRSMEKFKERTAGRFSPADIAGAVSLLVILVIIWLVRGSAPFLYRGGQQLVTLLTVILLYAALIPGSITSRVWSFKPFVAIGKISYSLYIWHYPVIDLISGVRRASFGTTMLEIALSFALAIAGYFLVETPCRRGALGRMWGHFKLIAGRIRGNSKIRKAQKRGFEEADEYGDFGDYGDSGYALAERKTPLLAGIPLKEAATVFMAVVLICSSVFCMVFGTALDRDHSRGRHPKLVHHMEMVAREEQQRVKNEEAIKAQQEAAKQEAEVNTGKDAKSYKDYNYLLIGDSVALTAAKDLNKAFPNMIVDAVNSRMSYETADILDDYLKKGWDGKAVIFALSTNGPITDELDTIRKKIGEDKQIFIINARAPYDEYPDQNNKLIKEFVEKDDQAYLIDWFKASNKHESWFDGDGTHMNKKGNKHYVELIDEVLASVYGE